MGFATMAVSAAVVGGSALSGPRMARARDSVVDDWTERLRTPADRCRALRQRWKEARNRSKPSAIVTFGT